MIGSSGRETRDGSGNEGIGRKQEDDGPWKQLWAASSSTHFAETLSGGQGADVSLYLPASSKPVFHVTVKMTNRIACRKKKGVEDNNTK